MSIEFLIDQLYNNPIMKIKKAYRFRLKVSAVIEKELSQYAGHARFLWNKCCQLNLERLRQSHRILRYQEMDFWSKVWKESEEYGFLKECPAHILQQKLRDLDRTFCDAFDKTQPNKRLPRLKKRGVSDSFRFPEPRQIELRHKGIKVPKLGWLSFYQSEKVLGELRNVTISRRGKHWYVSIQVEMDSEEKSTGTGSVGIDVGIVNFATLSTGEKIQPLNSFRGMEKRLGIAQRKLAKKRKFSERWKKQVSRVRGLHEQIRDMRRDFLHKTTTDISKNHAMVVVEDLNVKNMSRSASGDRENPGVHVSAKSGLNKSILDQGWYEFRRQLEYKLNWRGGLLLKVSPKYSSQRCSNCQDVRKENRRSQREFVCVCCGYCANADENAAKNILAAGHAVLARGASALSAA